MFDRRRPVIAGGFDARPSQLAASIGGGASGNAAPPPTD
jgi:hypothetical protein